MQFLHTLARIIWQYWLLRVMFYAICFWSIDTVSSVVIGCERVQGEKIVTCILIGLVLAFLEGLQPPLPTESRERRRAIGLAACALLLAAAGIVTALGMT